MPGTNCRPGGSGGAAVQPADHLGVVVVEGDGGAGVEVCDAVHLVVGGALGEVLDLIGLAVERFARRNCRVQTSSWKSKP